MPIFADRSLGKSLEFFDITIEMVEKYIKKLNASKSQGPDNLHPKLLLEIGTKSSPENYRPISLTSVVSKIMEKLVRDKIIGHMEENGLFTKHQHGFRKGYSCVTQLIDV